MALARTCDACLNPIRTPHYYDVMVSKKDVNETPEQTGEQVYADFCFICVSDGNAIKFLFSELRENKNEPK